MNDNAIDIHCALGLGTVQFGMPYGVSNKTGIPEKSEIKRIFDKAWERNIRFCDTAPFYGQSEGVIGDCIGPNQTFKIVTKTPKFEKNVISREDADRLETTFLQSLNRLKKESVYGLLVHSPNDLLARDGHRILDRMNELKGKHRVQKVGVSVYTHHEIEEIANRFAIDMIQLPVNMLDHRLIKSGALQMLKRKNVEIHARSLFLQGLLLMPTREIPEALDKVKPHIEKIHAQLKKLNVSALTAALAFIQHVKEIDVGLVGVCAERELIEISRAWDEAATKKPALASFWDEWSYGDERILNPSIWNPNPHRTQH